MWYVFCLACQWIALYRTPATLYRKTTPSSESRSRTNGELYSSLTIKMQTIRCLCDRISYYFTRMKVGKEYQEVWLCESCFLDAYSRDLLLN